MVRLPAIVPLVTLPREQTPRGRMETAPPRVRGLWSPGQLPRNFVTLNMWPCFLGPCLFFFNEESSWMACAPALPLLHPARTSGAQLWTGVGQSPGGDCGLSRGSPHHPHLVSKTAGITVFKLAGPVSNEGPLQFSLVQLLSCV